MYLFALLYLPVGERCTYQSSLGVRLSVSSGQPFIDLSTCSRCLCRDGEAVLCETILRDSDCNLINPTPGPTRDCTVRGRTVPSGESIKVQWILTNPNILGPEPMKICVSLCMEYGPESHAALKK